MRELYYGAPTAPLNSRGFIDSFLDLLKTAVKQSVEEVIQNKMYENVVLDQNLTAKQLCERWHISRNTLQSWVKNKVITPLQMGGRKNVFSLRDIREAEANGYIKGMA